MTQSSDPAPPGPLILSGRPVAEAVYTELRTRIEALVRAGHRPGLGTILVGDDPASAGYVPMKQQRASELAIASPHQHLPATATQADLVAAIRAFNEADEVDAMLVRASALPAALRLLLEPLHLRQPICDDLWRLSQGLAFDVVSAGQAGSAQFRRLVEDVNRN
ncbi:MAG: hypothetical protein M3O70_13285, partial [Actinomycetota bacterium]|nr:hypothetical protein [Actinomycetota bacterium]